MGLSALLKTVMLHHSMQSVSCSNHAGFGIRSFVPEWPMQSYETEKFLAPNLTITQIGEATAPGYLFFAPTGDDASTVSPLIMTDQNELVWHAEHTEDPSISKNNFKIQHIRGTPYLTWWDGVMIHTFGHGYGSIRILDNTYTEVFNFCPPQLQTVTTDGSKYPCHLDMHENYVTDRGTIVVTVYNVTQVDMRSVGGPEDGWIWDSLFYEYDIATNRELFRWSALDYLKDIPLTDSRQPLVVDGSRSGEHRSNPWDYFHINSVEPLEDGYLVNARHTFAFYKVSRTGAVEWQVQGEHGGDFHLDPAANFSWQHDPRVAQKTSTGYRIQLYDNANSESALVTKPTRGLLLDVNLATHSVTLLRRLADPSDTVISASQGSYQTLPDNHVLLGYGQVAKIREFNAAGASIYTAQFAHTEPNVHAASYRAYRFEWHAQPTAKPKLVARGLGDSGDTLVTMSWNGATDYDAWRVYMSDDDAAAVAAPLVVPRVGFETRIVVEQAPKYVRVEALREGVGLGSSETVEVERSVGMEL